MTTPEQALWVFIGGSSLAGTAAAAVIVYMVKGALATAVQHAGARELERLKVDLARVLEKERQEAATALEGFKAQLTLEAEVRRQVAARKVGILEEVMNVTHTLIGRVLAKEFDERMSAFNEYGLLARRAEAFADRKSLAAMNDLHLLMQERALSADFGQMLEVAPLLEVARRKLLATIREELQLAI